MSLASRMKGIAIIETAAGLVILSVLLTSAVGLATLLSDGYAIRRVTEGALANHSAKLLRNAISSEGDIQVTLDDTAARNSVHGIVQEAVAQIKNVFPEVDSDTQFKVEVSLRQLVIDPHTGENQGYLLPQYDEQCGSLSIPTELDSKLNLEVALRDYLNDPQSLVSEPTAELHMGGSSWRFLPRATLCAIRIFIKLPYSPAQFIHNMTGGDGIISDQKVITLRGGLL